MVIWRSQNISLVKLQALKKYIKRNESTLN